MRELFIYYRVEFDRVPAALTALREMQARLIEARPHVRARMLYRLDTPDRVQTWMEIYSTDFMQDPEGISIELQAEIETRAACLAPFIHGTRHVEAFVACAS